jgi:hypothetical protein
MFSIVIELFLPNSASQTILETRNKARRDRKWLDLSWEKELHPHAKVNPNGTKMDHNEESERKACRDCTL